MSWTADKRYCLSADGRVVADDDPEARTVLIGEGSQMPLADAERYGLVTPESEARAKQVAGPPANKARSASSTKDAPASGGH